MKLSFGVFICLMVLKLSSAHSVTIDCDFHTSILDGVYSCRVRDKKVFTGERFSIEKAKGQHEEGKNDDDVHHFGLYEAYDLKYFPSNLNNVFKNLKVINIFLSKIFEITSEDLKVFPKLENLHLQLNQIEVIRDGTFDFNQELEFINLVGNKISHIDPNAFSKLPKLDALFLFENVCKFDWASNREKVLELIKEIEQGSCTSDKFEIKTIKEENTENSSNQNSRKFLLIFTVFCMFILFT